MAIALEPDYAYSYLGRADMYMLKGRTEEARADYHKVIELDTIPGNNSCAQYAYQALGERDKAIAFMDSIISRDKDYAGNYYDAACLAARMGDVDISLKYLTTAFEKGYRRIAHIMADDDMAQVRETAAFKDPRFPRGWRQFYGKQEEQTCRTEPISALSLARPASRP